VEFQGGGEGSDKEDVIFHVQRYAQHSYWELPDDGVWAYSVGGIQNGGGR